MNQLGKKYIKIKYALKLLDFGDKGGYLAVNTNVTMNE